jgi:hypothetical protein
VRLRIFTSVVCGRQSCLQAAFQAAPCGAGNRACSRLSGGSQTLSTGDRNVSSASCPQVSRREAREIPQAPGQPGLAAPQKSQSLQVLAIYCRKSVSPVGQAFSLRRASAHLSALAVRANELLLQTWRGHSCLRSLVGHASACPVERSSTGRRYFSGFVSSGIETAKPQKFVADGAGGLKGRLQAGLPATRKRRPSVRLETDQLLEAMEIRRTSKRPAEAGRRLNACPTKVQEFWVVAPAGWKARLQAGLPATRKAVY